MHAKSNTEDALTAFLCLVDDGMLKHVRDCTIAEAHRVKEDSSWYMTLNELKAFIALIDISGAKMEKAWGFAFFQEDYVPKQIPGNHVIPTF